MLNIQADNLNLWYSDFHALINVNTTFAEKQITAIIGPSGCGKSTLLRTFNRMNDLIEGVRTSGEVLIDNENILDENADLVALRKKSVWFSRDRTRFRYRYMKISPSA
jgi:phosphate transport system ATP-binding protein